MLQRIRGFTLIELMVTIALVAIILGLAAPSFETAIRNSRATSLTNEVVGALHFARSEAIRLNQTLKLCGSDGATTPACAGSGTYENGWIVTDLQATPEIFRSTAAPTALQAADIDGPSEIRFSPRGMAEVPGVPIPAGQRGYVFAIQLPGCRDDERRLVIVTRSGSVLTQRVNCI